MAGPAYATSIPSFLLPRLTWSPANTAIRAGHGTAVRRASSQRHISSMSRRIQPQPKHIAISPLLRQHLPSRHPQPTPTTFARQQQPFSSTPTHARDHHFDTLKFVQRLQSEGFSEEQAIAMMRVLSDVIEESIQNLTRTMVLREDALKTSYTQKVDFSRLRAELLALDTAESQLTRASHERLTNELAKLNARLRDEILRTQASVRLDLNLEKGRIREETQGQELKIKETETRIEQEVAGLRERVEQVKFSTLQWLMGVCTGTAALILGAWRLLM